MSWGNLFEPVHRRILELMLNVSIDSPDMMAIGEGCH